MLAVLAVSASILLTAVRGGWPTWIFRDAKLTYIRGPDMLTYPEAEAYCKNYVSNYVTVDGLVIINNEPDVDGLCSRHMCWGKHGRKPSVYRSECVYFGNGFVYFDWSPLYIGNPVCKADVTVGASIAISQDYLAEAFPNATFVDLDAQQSVGVDTAPLQNGDDANSTPFPSVIVGASCGAMVFVAAAVVVLVRKRRNKATFDESIHAEAHHVSEMSPTDIVDPATADIPAEDGAETEVVVKEDVASKESESVSV